MSKPIVLITSASGRIGKELVALLAQEGSFAIRACCFNMDKAESLAELGAILGKVHCEVLQPFTPPR